MMSDMKKNSKQPPEYKVWAGMRQRCNNPNTAAYEHYGGRGITVCEAWSRFSAFLEDMGPRPSSRHSIDRIDNDGNYEPGNCRWATRKTQSRNRSNNRKVTIGGETHCLSDWCEQYGTHFDTARKRLERGYPPEEALKSPARRKLTLAGESHTLGEWAEIKGMNYGTLYDRIRRGMTFEQALTTPLEYRGIRSKPSTRKEQKPMDQKTKKVSFRVTPELRYAMEELARAQNLTLSAFICARMREYSAGKLKNKMHISPKEAAHV